MTLVVKEVRCLLHGGTEDVGLKAYISRKARDLGVLGYVRTAPGGGLFVLAQGTHAELEEFLAFIRVGPRLAKGGALDVEWKEDLEVTYPDFSIKEDMGIPQKISQSEDTETDDNEDTSIAPDATL